MVIDLLLHLVTARLLALVIGSFLLGASLVHPTARVVRVVVLRAILRQAATITFGATLHLPLMIFELDAVVEDLIANWTAVRVVGLAACPATF